MTTSVLVVMPYIKLLSSFTLCFRNLNFIKINNLCKFGWIYNKDQSASQKTLYSRQCRVDIITIVFLNSMRMDTSFWENYSVVSTCLVKIYHSFLFFSFRSRFHHRHLNFCPWFHFPPHQKINDGMNIDQSLHFRKSIPTSSSFFFKFKS